MLCRQNGANVVQVVVPSGRSLIVYVAEQMDEFSTRSLCASTVGVSHAMSTKPTRGMDENIDNGFLALARSDTSGIVMMRSR